MALAIGLALSASRLPAAEWWTDLGARELMPTSTRPDAAKPHLRLLAPIHGVASGQIAVRTETPITSLRVSVPDFVGDGGSSEGTAEEIASGNHRRNRGSGGGGGGGRVAIYSQIDIGGPGKNKVETNIPAAILLSGGKGGEAALDGATGTLYDGTWPGVR